MGFGMKTLHSLSGGRSSSFMAVHYPADYYLFALVQIQDLACASKDKGLIQAVSDKIGKDFIATAESDETLKVMLDLEQMIGKEVIWICGITFDNAIKKKRILPSSLRRYCTTEMKMKPIFEWWQKHIGEKVKMGIGYRYDEKERADRFSQTFRGVVGKRGTLNKWEDVEWREGWFPLIDDGIGHYTVYKWAILSGLTFPKDSNCVGCFHKPVQQLRKNWDEHPEKMQWFADKEKLSGKGTWKEGINYEQIKKIHLQLDFNFGTGAGCDGGFCTD